MTFFQKITKPPIFLIWTYFFLIMMLNIMKFDKKSNFGNFGVSGTPHGENRLFLTFLRKNVKFNKRKLD